MCQGALAAALVGAAVEARITLLDWLIEEFPELSIFIKSRKRVCVRSLTSSTCFDALVIKFISGVYKEDRLSRLV